LTRINTLKKDSAPGPNGISNQFLIAHGPTISYSLYLDFITFDVKVDSFWKQGFITPIPKKDDLSIMDNWRPISLLNTDWKIYTSQVNGYNSTTSAFKPSSKKQFKMIIIIIIIIIINIIIYQPCSSLISSKLMTQLNTRIFLRLLKNMQA